MSRDDKLVARLKQLPPEVDFDDVRRVLEMDGWEIRRGGKHYVATKAGQPERLTIATVSGRKVKRYIIKQVLTALGLDE